MKVIAISGGSCTGKTTVLEALRAKGYAVDTLKVARVVLKRLGLTAEDLKTADEQLIFRFQEELMRVKAQHELDLRATPFFDFNAEYKRDDLIFVERSLVDLYGFACMWHTHTGWYARWLEKYRTDIAGLQSSIYDSVFVLPYGGFAYEDDGERVVTTDGNLWALDGIVKVEVFAHSSRAIVIKSASVEDRVAEIESYL